MPVKTIAVSKLKVWVAPALLLTEVDIGQDFFRIQEKKNGTYVLWDKYAEYDATSDATSLEWIKIH